MEIEKIDEVKEYIIIKSIVEVVAYAESTVK